MCEKHFEESCLNRGKRITVKKDSVPTIHSKEALKRPSTLPTHEPVPRKLPRKRNLQEDQLDAYRKIDKINDFSVLNESHAPPGFSTKRNSDCIVFYRIDEETSFPNIFESIKVDSNLHVQLQFNGHYEPLPPWFVDGRDAKLTRFSMLENLPPYIKKVAENDEGEEKAFWMSSRSENIVNPKDVLHIQLHY